MSQTLHARVYGRVQGVNFRATVAERARALGLAGWIANRADGSVELRAAGAELEGFRRWLADSPGSARVDRIETLAPLNERLPEAFEIR